MKKSGGVRRAYWRRAVLETTAILFPVVIAVVSVIATMIGITTVMDPGDFRLILLSFWLLAFPISFTWASQSDDVHELAWELQKQAERLQAQAESAQSQDVDIRLTRF